jgi:UDP-glucose 4-epimerase
VGYIGSFTVIALLDAGYKVVIVDNLYNSSDEVINRIEILTGTRPKLYGADITDEAALDKIFAENPDIDNVIHFAALKVFYRNIILIPKTYSIFIGSRRVRRESPGILAGQCVW